MGLFNNHLPRNAWNKGWAHDTPIDPKTDRNLASNQGSGTKKDAKKARERIRGRDRK